MSWSAPSARSDHWIPLVDLQAQHREVAVEVETGWARVVSEASFILGAEVAAFEAEFAAFSGVAHCAGVGNGTDAIELALRARGVGHGDEVILPVNTFIATAEAVLRTGARPVFVDCDPTFLLLDPKGVAERVTARTRAVIAVHLHGQMAPVERIALAVPPVVDVIEDAAQSHGATRHARPSGSVGTMAATSFYPGKNLGAYGDAGAVLTDDDELIEVVRALRSHGGVQKYVHDRPGANSRLDSLQAVVLRAKLPRLAHWNQQRRAAAERYQQLLASAEPLIGLPSSASGNEHVWHLYVVRVPARDRVLKRLHSVGIGAGVHYPIPLHLQPVLAELGHGPGDFPVAEAAAEEILSLPLFPGITESQQERVAGALVDAAHDEVGSAKQP